VFLVPNNPRGTKISLDSRLELLSRDSTSHSKFHRPPASTMTMKEDTVVYPPRTEYFSRDSTSHYRPTATTTRKEDMVRYPRTGSFSRDSTSHNEFYRPTASKMTSNANPAMYPPRATTIPIPRPPHTSRRRVKEVNLEFISESDRIIMYVDFSLFRLVANHFFSPSVMGLTGVGKSTVRCVFCPTILSILIAYTQFIEAATRRNGQTVGHGMRSFTSDILPFRCRHPVNNMPVVFLDTPGFDDTYQPDYAILDKINRWLEAM
jgi:hypothetical protein